MCRQLPFQPVARHILSTGQIPGLQTSIECQTRVYAIEFHMQNVLSSHLFPVDRYLHITSCQSQQSTSS